jgi:hypothetical protein
MGEDRRWAWNNAQLNSNKEKYEEGWEKIFGKKEDKNKKEKKDGK